MGTSLHYNKNGIRAILTIVFTIILIVSAFMITFQMKSGAYSEENVWGTFYNDERYVYDYGFLHYYSEGSGKGYNIWDDNADFTNGSTWEGKWTDADELINRRDRNKVVHNSDSRGWEYVRTEWQNQNNISQYTGIGGHNEYQPNVFDPRFGYGCPTNGGVQDGGSSIYWGIQRFNRYRRAAIKIYRREKPKPFHSKTSVDIGSTPSFISGTTIWIKPDSNINIRAVGYDKYPDNYGQQAQYEACVRDTSIKVSTPDNSILFGRTFNAMTNTVSVVNQNYDFGTNIFKGMWANWRGYGDNNRSYIGGYYLNGLESTMTICPQNNVDLRIQARHTNKYNIVSENSGEWHDGFSFGNETNERFKLLSTDGDAPTCSKMTFENFENSLFLLKIPNVKDPRSGVKNVKITVWDKYQQKTYSAYKRGEDYLAEIPTSDFVKRGENYYASAELTDNVGNKIKIYPDSSIYLGKADIVFDNMSITEVNSNENLDVVKQGNVYLMRFSIKNIGYISAENFEIKIYYHDGTEIFSTTVEKIKNGESLQFDFLYDVPVEYAQRHKSIYGYADYGNKVDEIREDNNEKNITFLSDYANEDPIPDISDITTGMDFTGKTITCLSGESIYVTAAKSYFPQVASERYFMWSMKMPNGETVDFAPVSAIPAFEHYECIIPPTNLLNTMAEGRYKLYVTAYYYDGNGIFRYGTASCEFNITAEPKPFANIITRLR
jgi:hypothetical protein